MAADTLDQAKTRVTDAVDRLADDLDFPVDPDDGEAGFGSTDCGNVSQVIPTIHPCEGRVREDPG